MNEDTGKAGRLAAIGAMCFGAVCLPLVWIDAADFLRSYLAAYLFMLGVPLGAMGIAMMYYITGGLYGRAIAAELKAASVTVWLLLLLAAPLIVGRGAVFSWGFGSSTLSPHKAIYFAPWFVTLRAALYFLCWIILGQRVRQWQPGSELKSALGILILLATASLAAIDWIMAVDREWYSTSIGAIFLGSAAPSALALLLLLRGATIGFSSAGAANDRHQETKLIRDLAKLLLTFLVFWLYLQFAQYLIYWCGNLPSQVGWYAERTMTPWRFVIAASLALSFFIPLFTLLAGMPYKRVLLGTSLIVIAGQALHFFWLILPTFEFHPRFTPIAAVLVFGFLFCSWCCAYFYARRSLHDTLGG